MKNLPLNLLLAKNRMAQTSPWLILLDVDLKNGTILRLVKNNEDITFNSQVYAATAFELDASRESSKGEIPSLNLKVCNVTRILQAYLEDLNGAVGSTVTTRIVNAAYLSENYSELEMTFDVMATSSDAMWVTFRLGAPNPLRSRYPRFRYIAGHCGWVFKSRECNYTGASTDCARTLDACKGLGNSPRFGGYPGLNNYGIRLA